MNIKILSLVLLICFFANYGFSQEYLFTRYNVEEGLSQCVVKCIFQDSEGYMWFGTQNGVNKFNGYEFEVFQHIPGDKNSLSDNWIYSITEDANRNIWIATRKGLHVYNKDNQILRKYKNIPEDKNSIFNDIITGVCFGKIGIVANTPPFINIYNEKQNNFTRINTGLEHEGSVPDEKLPVIIDSEGIIWAASQKGLAMYEPESKNIKIFKNMPNGKNTISHNHVTALFEDKNGKILIGTENGLNIYDKKNKTFKYFFNNTKNENYSNNNFIHSLVKDKQKNIWLGTNNGLFKLVNKGNSYKFENFKNNLSPNSVSNDFIVSLYVDKSEILWVGTFNGLNKINLKKKKFNIIRNSNSTNSVQISDDIIASVFKENDNTIWIGTWGNGLNIYDKKTRKVEIFSSSKNGNYKINNDFIHVIFRDEEKNIWIGTRNGIDIFDKKQNKFTGIKQFFNLKNIPDFRSVRINHILTDYKKNIWIAAQNGLYKINIKNDSYKNFTAETGEISDNLIYQIMEAENKKIWIATMGGLDVYNPENNSFSHYKNNPDSANSLCDDFTISLCEDCDANIWVGTQSGLTKLNPETNIFTYFTEKDGILIDVVYEILSDNKNNMWIATGSGLFMFDYKKNRFKLFKVEDGLQSKEFNTACYKSSDGELFFGGIKGLNYFYPDSIKNNNYVAPIVITYFEKTNNFGKQKININNIKNVELTYKDFEFTIEFASLDYTNPKKNIFSYKMSGISENWIETGNRNFVSFSNLPSGKYVFHIKGTNSDGVWNEKNTPLTIIISPPWWKTKYAYTIYLLFVIFFIASVIKRREKQLIADKLILEKKVEERTVEITKQKEVIEKNHKEITDSINYASRIQNALLPGEKMLKKYFSEFFVFYRPKEVVSGDFFWFKKINKYVVVAAADCTGHGVPGAFVSMLGISFLNEIIRRTEIKKASEVLEAMRNQVKESLKQTGKYNATKDGMDIALCVIDTETNTLQYAGAYNPLYLILDGKNENERIEKLLENPKVKIHSQMQIIGEPKIQKLIEIKADRQPVSIYAKEKAFTNNIVKLQKGDILYLFSDGFIDQFNHKTEEKYKSKRFRNLILSIFRRPLKEQKNYFEKEFYKWKKKSIQVDDVLVLGMKI